VAYAIYGVGPRGSYRLLLYADIDSFEVHEEDFLKWVEKSRGVLGQPVGSEIDRGGPYESPTEYSK
jgi:hypothetical protein